MVLNSNLGNIQANQSIQTPASLISTASSNQLILGSSNNVTISAPAGVIPVNISVPRTPSSSTDTFLTAQTQSNVTQPFVSTSTIIGQLYASGVTSANILATNSSAQIIAGTFVGANSATFYSTSSFHFSSVNTIYQIVLPSSNNDPATTWTSNAGNTGFSSTTTGYYRTSYKIDFQYTGGVTTSIALMSWLTLNGTTLNDSICVNYLTSPAMQTVNCTIIMPYLTANQIVAFNMAAGTASGIVGSVGQGLYTNTEPIPVGTGIPTIDTSAILTFSQLA